MKKFANGRYKARITEINRGISESKQTPYILCRFENGERYIDERIYITERSKIILKIIFNCSGIYDGLYNADDLIGKFIEIEVGSGSYTDEDGVEKTYGEVTKFYRYCSNQVNNYGNDDYEYKESIADYEEIFGVSRREIAADMDIEASSVTINDIMEYCGY